VSNLLFYVTFSANFFLYCVTGDRFRTTLRHVARRWFCCDADEMMRPLSTRNWTQSQRHRTTSTLTSSLTTTTATAVPQSVTVPQDQHDPAAAQVPPHDGTATTQDDDDDEDLSQLRPVGSDACLVTDKDEMHLVTAFTDSLTNYVTPNDVTSNDVRPVDSDARRLDRQRQDDGACDTSSQ